MVAPLVFIAALDDCRCEVMFGLLLASLTLVGVVLEREASLEEVDDDFPADPLKQYLPRLLIVRDAEMHSESARGCILSFFWGSIRT